MDEILKENNYALTCILALVEAMAMLGIDDDEAWHPRFPAFSGIQDTRETSQLYEMYARYWRRCWWFPGSENAEARAIKIAASLGTECAASVDDVHETRERSQGNEKTHMFQAKQVAREAWQHSRV